ncbi:MAG: MXAN_5187 C-terminal domain-containing protein [Myxococcota bacterium]
MDFNAEITRLENMIEDLKKRYELFFFGLEKKPPNAERDQVERKLRELLNAFITNSGQRYRLKSLSAKYNSYQRYWDRILQQIEDGTYQRELMKRQIIQREFAKEAYKKKDVYVIGEEDENVLEKRATSRGLSDEYIKELYDSYVQVKQTLGESTGNITVEAFKKSLERQLPILKEKYKTDNIEFKISVKGGKATIKAIPAGKDEE